MSVSASNHAIQILQHLAAQGVVARRLANDSRTVQPGDVFLAYPGHHVDGRAFMQDAVARGAAALICERSEKVGDGETPRSKSPWGATA